MKTNWELEMRPWLILGAASLAACSPQPTVTYSYIPAVPRINSEQLVDNAIAFRENAILIERGQGENPTTPKVSLVNMEFSNFRLNVAPHRTIFLDTKINVAKSDNTDLPSELGISVTDRREEVITALGTIISAGIGLLEVDADYHNIHPLMPLIEQHDGDPTLTSTFQSAPTLNGIRTLYTLSPVPPDARKFDSATFSEMSPSPYYVYAACRELVARIPFPEESERRTFIFKISDPRYFQTIRFPTKGKIVHHSNCGASASSEAETGVSSWSALAEAVKAQAEAIQQALSE